MKLDHVEIDMVVFHIMLQHLADLAGRCMIETGCAEDADMLWGDADIRSSGHFYLS